MATSRNQEYSRHQVGLELVKIDIEGTVEAKGCSDGGNNLSNETIEVGEARGDYAQLLLANIVDSLVINLFSTKNQCEEYETRICEP